MVPKKKLLLLQQKLPLLKCLLLMLPLRLLMLLHPLPTLQLMLPLRLLTLLLHRLLTLLLHRLLTLLLHPLLTNPSQHLKTGLLAGFFTSAILWLGYFWAALVD
ncbi:MAG: hypothetical protein ABL877_00140 [Thiobacillus sp.]